MDDAPLERRDGSARRSGRDVTVVWGLGSSSPQEAEELLRIEVGRLLGTVAADIELSRSCMHCGSSKHGRPRVLPPRGERAPFVSLSRAGEAMIVAVSDCGPVGVDIEGLESARFAGFDGVALHERETAWTIESRAVTWVRKEALLKARGDGLQIDPRLVRLSDHDEPPRLVEWSAPHPPERTVWMQDVPIDGYAACVAVLSDETPLFRVGQAVPEGAPR